MGGAHIEFLPAHAELARRAAGGDGAAFMRVYDTYSEEIFATALTATGSSEYAASATQTAFLRILRWPPALGATDDEVAELLCALALGGDAAPRCSKPDAPEAYAVARLVDVGWMRSETVAKAGARFDADWSVQLWSPGDGEASAEPPLGPAATANERPARRRRLLPRFTLPIRLPAPATAAVALVLVLLSGFAATVLIGGSGAPMEPAPAAAGGGEQTAGDPRSRADARQAAKSGARWGKAELLRRETLAPLLAP